MLSVPYIPHLMKRLQSEEEREGYLQAAIEDGDPQVIELVQRDIEMSRVWKEESDESL